MAGLFSAPKMPPPPAPVSKDNTAEEDRKKRLDAIERRRRGRAGTIETSARGLGSSGGWVQPKKKLLGE